MKILSLRFKNLNSLYGEWTIDFTHPQFLTDGIFAISGPTGAGKSTILDAICLALYGRTPRLERVNQSTNDIISRKTKECFAEVVFASDKGTFRCFWGQTRASKSLKLQPVSFEVSDALTGTIIASKIKDTSEAIIERTGMDFNRFTQSMLLAQGGFAKFLQASAADRAPILEEITGTEIYRTISKLVFERYKEEKQSLDVLQASVNAIKLLNTEELAEVEEELREKSVMVDELNTKRKTAEDALSWINAIVKLENESKELDRRSQLHQQTVDDFEPDRRILQRANQAFELEADFVLLAGLRDAQAKDTAELYGKEVRKVALSNLITSASASLNRVSAEFADRKVTALVDRQTITLVRQYDLQIQNAIQQRTASEEAVRTQFNFIKKLNAEIQDINSAIELSIQQTGNAEIYLESNKADAALSSKVELIKRSFDELNAKIREHSQRVILRDKALEKYKRLVKENEDQTTALNSALIKLGEATQHFKDCMADKRILLNDRPLEEYKKELNYLNEQMHLLNKIKSLEQHRSELVDGKPCPLCGAELHPYAEGNVPATDSTVAKIKEINQLLLSADRLEVALTKAEQEEINCKNAYDNAQLLLKTNHVLVTEAENDHLSLKKQEQEALNALSESRNYLLEILFPFGITTTEPADDLLYKLEVRRATWESNEFIKASADVKVNGLKGELSTQLALKSSAEDGLVSVQSELKRLENELFTYLDKRKELFGDKDPTIEEKKLEAELERLQKEEQAAIKEHDSLMHEQANLIKRIQELETAVMERRHIIAIKDFEFKAQLIQLDFADEVAFVNARRSKEVREGLSQTELNLRRLTAELTTLKTEKQKQLDSERSLLLTTKPKDELTAEIEQLKTECSVVAQGVGGLKEQLRKNANALKEQGDLLVGFESQQVVKKRWEKLNELIGHSEGDKYSRFAQGITFEIMVSYANRQLVRLTDRYLLERDTTEPLELNVVDNYQAGERRTTKNLSGGEAFYVSLALALGLSGMSSKNVRIDTLFLDEGFGTLDEESLESALNALTSLHHEGKLIGVISHVGSFRERINARIEVTKTQGGKSTLSGPGCSGESVSGLFA